MGSGRIDNGNAPELKPPLRGRAREDMRFCEAPITAMNENSNWIDRQAINAKVDPTLMHRVGQAHGGYGEPASSSVCEHFALEDYADSAWYYQHCLPSRLESVEAGGSGKSVVEELRDLVKVKLPKAQKLVARMKKDKEIATKNLEYIKASVESKNGPEGNKMELEASERLAKTTAEFEEAEDEVKILTARVKDFKENPPAPRESLNDLDAAYKCFFTGTPPP